MSWAAVGHWLAGSVMLFVAVVTASVASGDSVLFAWSVSLVFFLVGGIFWINAARTMSEKRMEAFRPMISQSRLRTVSARNYIKED